MSIFKLLNQHAKIVSPSLLLRGTVGLIRFNQVGIRVKVNLQLLVLVLVEISQASERPDAVVIVRVGRRQRCPTHLAYKTHVRKQATTGRTHKEVVVGLTLIVGPFVGFGSLEVGLLLDQFFHVFLAAYLVHKLGLRNDQRLFFALGLMMRLSNDILLRLSLVRRFFLKITDQFLIRTPCSLVLFSSLIDGLGLKAVTQFRPLLGLVHLNGKLRGIGQFLVVL